MEGTKEINKSISSGILLPNELKSMQGLVGTMEIKTSSLISHRLVRSRK